MPNTTKLGRIFYALALGAVAIHQLFYANFCNFLFPPWPHPSLAYRIAACIFSLLLIGACIALLNPKIGRTVALAMGGSFLLLFLLGQVPYEFIIIPYSKTHLGLWAVPLKETALAGGAFVIAASYPDPGKIAPKNPLIRILETLIPFGPFLFCFTMVSFGITHFFYAQAVQDLVPAWVPDHLFYTYFAGTALIASGVAIIIDVRVPLIALLLAITIFIWFIILHIPRALAQPLADQGNEITSALSALAFSGIALVIAGNSRRTASDKPGPLPINP